MSNMNVGFAGAGSTIGNIPVANLMAAADYTGNGAIETNRYESEIADIVRRDSVFLSRVDRVPATGQPHRYFDQSGIVNGSFTSTQSITPTPGGSTRTERPAFIKAITAQSNFGLFDVDVTRMQGQFAYVEAKDIEDITSGITLTSASAAWNGSDTSLSSPTTTQYVGLLTQISNQYTIGIGASIIDGLKTKVASMVSNPAQKVRPTAIYINPLALDMLEQEAKASHIELKTKEITVGVTVKYLATQAGDLPLIPDPFIAQDTTGSYGFAAPGSGNANYFAAIVTENMIEMPVVHGGDGNLNPRIFQLGLLSGLQGQYVGVLFDCVIAKLASYAHAVVAIVRQALTPV